MAKFWNFVFFQLGWFACVLGAANQQVFWAVLVTLAYIAFHVWYQDEPKESLRLLSRALLYGIVTDSLLVQTGYLNFNDPWPSSQLSPVWMWVLWVLVATTINGSLSWLRGRPVLGAVLGGLSALIWQVPPIPPQQRSVWRRWGKWWLWWGRVRRVWRRRIWRRRSRRVLLI